MVRLKCPKCANVIDAPAGSKPTCPMCGFSASATAVRPAATPSFAAPATARAGPPALSPLPAPAPMAASPFSDLSADAPLPRPGWVVMAAVFQFIGGGFAILGGLIVALVGGFFAKAFAEEFDRFGDAIGGLVAVFGILLILVGAFNIVLGVQNLNGRSWARVTTIVLSAISGAFNALGLVMGNPMSFFGLAFDVLIIVGLSLRPTVDWFAQQGRRAPA